MAKRVLIGLFVFSVLGIAIFLLYRSGFREGQVELKIEAPEEAVAGQEIEYKIIAENKNNFNLKNARLSFFYPEKSIALDQDGQPLDSSLVNDFNLGDFESRDKKEFVLKAVLTGEKGEIKKAKATFIYSP
jgi:hypothetical protein